MAAACHFHIDCGCGRRQRGAYRLGEWTHGGRLFPPARCCAFAGGVSPQGSTDRRATTAAGRVHRREAGLAVEDSGHAALWASGGHVGFGSGVGVRRQSHCSRGARRGRSPAGHHRADPQALCRTGLTRSSRPAQDAGHWPAARGDHHSRGAGVSQSAGVLPAAGAALFHRRRT